MAQDPVKSDEEFCTMISTWTDVNLSTGAGKEPNPDATIRELLVSGKNKDKFFILARGNEEKVLEDWATKCGFDSVDGGVISLNAIAKYGSKSGT